MANHGLAGQISFSRDIKTAAFLKFTWKNRFDVEPDLTHSLLSNENSVKYEVDISVELALSLILVL